jgi:hypothetical protein
MKDDFDTGLSSTDLKILLELGKELGFDPTGSREAEMFFCGLIARFNKTDGDFERWLRKEVGPLKCIGKKPKWNQSSDWPFTEDGPMTFVGQIDVPPGLFHDEASFYVFYESRTGRTKTLLQVA